MAADAVSDYWFDLSGYGGDIRKVAIQESGLLVSLICGQYSAELKRIDIRSIGHDNNLKRGAAESAFVPLPLRF
jgi:hypothetical protein